MTITVVGCQRPAKRIDQTVPDAASVLPDSPDRLATEPFAERETLGPLPQEARALGTRINRLAIALDRAERLAFEGANRQKNMLTSPFSMFILLTLLHEGSRGSSRDELTRILNPEGVEANSAQGVRSLLDTLIKTSTVKLEIASSIWVQRGLTVLPDFERALNVSYGAQTAALDFSHNAEDAVQRLNSWIDTHTNHFIPQAFGPGAVGPKTQLLAVNAVYFLGKWATPFKRSHTRPRPFRTATGTELEVPTMQTEANFAFVESSLGRSISLPYDDPDFSLTVVLPNDRTWFSRPLPEGFFDICTREARFQRIRLELPKFELQQGTDLVPALRHLGLSKAFGADADFSGIVQGSRVALSGISQQVRIRVDEDGTEAAAVTTAGLGAISAPPKAIEFVVDRPFLFALRSKRTGIVLFWGRVGFLDS